MNFSLNPHSFSAKSQPPPPRTLHSPHFLRHGYHSPVLLSSPCPSSKSFPPPPESGKSDCHQLSMTTEREPRIRVTTWPPIATQLNTAILGSYNNGENEERSERKKNQQKNMKRIQWDRIVELSSVTNLCSIVRMWGSKSFSDWRDTSKRWLRHIIENSWHNEGKQECNLKWARNFHICIFSRHIAYRL